MRLGRKLKEWEEAGLIDAEQRSGIEAYERQRARPVLLYALGGLGAFTIGTGFVAVVAANWDTLGKTAKLGLDLALALGLAALLHWAASTRRRWQTDVIAGIYYAFTLASIALLGQVYQLGAPLHHALLTWSAITLPCMTLVRGRFLGLLWLAGLTTTHVFAVMAWLTHLERTSRWPEAFLENAAVVLATLSWSLYLGLSHLPVFVRHRPAVTRGWREVSWVVWLLGGLGACFVFYADIDGDDVLRWGPLIALAYAIGLQALVARVYSDLSKPAQVALRLVLVAVPCVLVLAVSYQRLALPSVGAGLQVLLLALAAFMALQLGRVNVFNSLTALIALRVLVMYFEIFGSMLDTGLGLITGGLLTLALTYVWKRQSPELAARFANDRTGGNRAA